MKNQIRLLLMFLLFYSQAFAADNDVAAIKNVYTTFSSALLDQDGEKAYSLLDKNSRKYFD